MEGWGEEWDMEDYQMGCMDKGGMVEECMGAGECMEEVGCMGEEEEECMVEWACIIKI
jgi:hypothetical protein